MNEPNKIPKPTEEQKDYAAKLWNSDTEGLISAQNRILNYIFILNTGGLVATTTSLSKSSYDCYFISSFICFILGILLIVLHATFFYYTYQERFKNTKNLVEGLLGGKIPYKDFYDQIQKRKWFYGIAHYLALGSAFFLILGVISGAISLLK